MGRPVKRGVAYYPTDVDYYEDFKIIDLLSRYGPLGDSVYRAILSFVYREGYYLEVPMQQLCLSVVRVIGSQWAKSKEFVKEVIGYCAEVGLFDVSLFEQGVITSVGIQKRYAQITVRNKVNRARYWLLEPVCDTDAEDGDIPAKTEVSDAVTGIDAAEITQKKRKENQTKLKQQETLSAPDVAATGKQVGKASSKWQEQQMPTEVEQVVELFHQICVSLPKVKQPVGGYRQSAILFLWKQDMKLDAFRTAFEKVEASDFLSGRIPGKSWIASFDWILQEEHFFRILEGNYDNRQAAKESGPDTSYDLEALDRFWDSVPMVSENF